MFISKLKYTFIDYEYKKEIKIDLVNESMLFYKMPIDKQDALVKWISNNFIKIKTIYKDKTSLKLKQLFCEFPINNGEFKGAMDKCGFKMEQKLKHLPQKENIIVKIKFRK